MCQRPLLVHDPSHAQDCVEYLRNVRSATVCGIEITPEVTNLARGSCEGLCHPVPLAYRQSLCIGILSAAGQRPLWSGMKAKGSRRRSSPSATTLCTFRRHQGGNGVEKGVLWAFVC